MLSKRSIQVCLSQSRGYSVSCRPASFIPHMHLDLASSLPRGGNTQKRLLSTSDRTLQAENNGIDNTASPTPAEIDTYLQSKILHPTYGNDPLFEKCLKRAEENDIPDIQVSPLQGQFLSVLVKSLGAERVLEIGTLAGYSTSFLSKALPPHGHLDTLELNPHHAKIAQENFLEMDLFPFPKIHIGSALQTLQQKKGIPPEEGLYDFVFIDANKDQILEYFLESLEVTRKGGVVVVDNAIRRGKILPTLKEDPTVEVNGLRKLYDWIEKDNGNTVLSSGVQTVGSKGWDGFVIATKLV